MVRSIFRLIEYLGGNDGSIMRHEIFVYIFDGSLMVSVMIFFIARHPGDLTSLGRGSTGQELDGLTSEGGVQATRK